MTDKYASRAPKSATPIGTLDNSITPFKQTTLGPLPQDWETGLFVRLCESSAFGPRFSSEMYSSDGGVATLRTTDMDSEGNIDLSTMPRAAISPSSMVSHLLEPGDLLISRSGTCGIASIFPGHDIPVLPGAFLIRFRLHDRKQARFYRRYFNSSLGSPRLARLAVGGVQKNLKGSSILSLEVPIPPVTEQHRIVEVLDTLDKAILKTEQLIAKLKQMKQGLLHDLLTRGIDKNGELRDPERHSTNFKVSRLGTIPRCWEVVPLRELTTANSPITYGVVQPGPHDRNGILFVRGGDFPEGRIEIERLRTISKTIDRQFLRTRLRGGEVLVSLVGQPGSSAVVPTSIAGANVARQVAMIRLGYRIVPEFLQAFLSSETGQRNLLGDTLGTVQKVINLKELRELHVPVPSISEQKIVIAVLRHHVERQQAEVMSLSKLRLLKRGLMDDLLTGRVRVAPLLAEPPP
ncbi:restriction endonuclease subunit S [Sorangium sp. So ce726]|uniref:restriction endonuclease subunit S n=1 Tax=Sorangium sp. So ce726 TaxID=3133319 RepID=UPI003F628DC9